MACLQNKFQCPPMVAVYNIRRIEKDHALRDNSNIMIPRLRTDRKPVWCDPLHRVA